MTFLRFSYYKKKKKDKPNDKAFKSHSIWSSLPTKENKKSIGELSVCNPNDDGDDDGGGERIEKGPVGVSRKVPTFPGKF